MIGADERHLADMPLRPVVQAALAGTGAVAATCAGLALWVGFSSLSVGAGPSTVSCGSAMLPGYGNPLKAGAAGIDPVGCAQMLMTRRTLAVILAVAGLVLSVAWIAVQVALLPTTVAVLSVLQRSARLGPAPPGWRGAAGSGDDPFGQTPPVAPSTVTPAAWTGAGEGDAAWSGWFAAAVVAAAGCSLAVLVTTAVALVAGWWTGATYF